MESQKRQAAYIGNGPSETQTEKGKDPTEGLSRRSLPNTDSASGSITSAPDQEEAEIPSDLLSSLNSGPNSIVEALGLLQTRLYDLKSQKLRIILQGSKDGKLFIVISWPEHTLGIDNGHILADGLPVLKERKDHESDTGK